MLDGMIRLLPTADVGFVGLARDEESLVAATYANRLPANLSGRDVFMLDPMLATGGTLETVITMLSQRDAASVTAVCLLAAPEGIDRIKATFPGDEPLPVRVVTAAMDERLNSAATSSPASAMQGIACSGRSDPKPGRAMSCPGTVVFPRTARALEASCAISRPAPRSWLRWDRA